MMDRGGDWLRGELNNIWGYDDFRYPQRQVIESFLAKRDCLVVMPTGAGKSICFQLPALVSEGLTLVVSPLIALMENQVGELKHKGWAVDFLHGEMGKGDRTRVIYKLEQQELKLLYLSPETLLSPVVWQIISREDFLINGLVIDEAHCVVQWGKTFRPSYTRLGAIRPSLLQVKHNHPLMAIACFTATASLTTQKIICDTIGLNNPQKFIISPYRQNIQLKIKQIWTPRARKKQLINFLNNTKRQSGLIYIRTRKEAENISNYLNQNGYVNKSYHGGLPSIKRRQIEQDWLEEKIKFVVCTNAFGMGINKQNLRWIIHYQVPLLLSDYLQEIGRGGRDGKLSQALSIISESTGIFDNTDKKTRSFFMAQTLQYYQETQNLLPNFSRQSTNFVSKENELYLGILTTAKQLNWLNPFQFQLKLNQPQKKINEMIKYEKQLIIQMEQYLTTKSCRWSFLMGAFNHQINSSFRCGVCDNCTKN
ncbi:ATP-dependent DNA helicase RecQ [Cyanobacterium stanieri LEGE 03274]|uniref:ATP-dependent DNA helicase RecQ n=1 Tax=Cyanobacterium stanieri LEGE 03274 TaxID=1828756 RepID=A0ABR9V4V0_9CHRO|nr:RecQ family ATP-dependent DNA helicase [Cyanobacterium stanieri]MBE9222902.1 ATP-dependent DNA helicase RecQ [Cyanobacterium stanieri LEGE 03274]